VLPGVDVQVLKRLLQQNGHDVNRALARHLGEPVGNPQPRATLSLAERIRRNPRQRRTSHLGQDFSGGSDLDSEGADPEVVELDPSDSRSPEGSPSTAPHTNSGAENLALLASLAEGEGAQSKGAVPKCAIRYSRLYKNFSAEARGLPLMIGWAAPFPLEVLVVCKGIYNGLFGWVFAGRSHPTVSNIIPAWEDSPDRDGQDDPPGPSGRHVASQRIQDDPPGSSGRHVASQRIRNVPQPSLTADLLLSSKVCTYHSQFV
jgi:hypothetical protein